jgi:hypothetical protein
MVSLISGLIIIAVFIFILVKSKDKSKWGINLKRVYCPVCGAKQPIIRMPDSMEQAAWGGTTCPKCHTRLDKYGKVIAEE